MIGKLRITMAVVAAAGLLVGCNQNQMDRGGTTQNRASQHQQSTKSEPKAATPAAAESKPAESKPAPAAESKPAAKPATTAAAPASSAPASNATRRGDTVSVSQAFPTGDQRTSAVMLTTVMPAQVRANTPYNFEYQVTNLTNGTLNNVIVANENNSNLAISSSTPAANGGKWVIPTIGPGKTEVIKCTGTASQVGKSGNCASVTYQSSLCAMTDVVMPALAITKATTPAEGTPCDTFTYTIEVKNTGSGSTTGVRIKDTLPAGMTLADGKTSIDDAVGDLAAGQSARRSYQVKATKGGKFDNKATAVADGGLTAESNTVSNVVRQPSIALTTECPKDIRVGKSVAVKLNVKAGPDAACGATTVKATLPPGATGVTADQGGVVAGGNVTWNLGSLGANESRALTINMKPGAGTNQVVATANCSCAQPVTQQCSFGVQGVPDIGTGISDDNGVVEVGQNHEYVFSVKNQGQVDLTNVKVEGTLDEGLAFVNTTWAGNAQAAGSKVTWNIGTLKVGETKTFKFNLKGNKAGVLIIQTVTTSDQTRPVRNDEQVNYVD